MALEVKARIIKNTLFLLAGNLVEQMISFLLVIAISRFLGNTGLGEYSFIFSLTWIVVILMNPGLDYLLLKEISRDEAKTDSYASNMFFIKLFLGGVALIVSLLMIFLLPKSPSVRLSIGIASASFFISGLAGVFFQIIQARECMGINAVIKIIERLWALGMGLYLLLEGYSLPWVVFALMVSGLIRDGLYYFFSRSLVRLKYRLDLPVCRFLLKESSPFFFSIIFIQIYFRADTVMLSLMKGDQVTGWYSAAYKFIEVLRFIPFLLVTAILPPISKAFKGNPELVKDIFLRTFRYLLSAALPLCLFIFVAASQIILFFYGSSFDISIYVLKILIWGTLFSFLNVLYSNFLNFVDRQKIVMGIAGFVALCNILLNLGFVPLLAQNGAAISMVFSEALNFLILSFQVRKFYHYSNFLSCLLPIALASLSMGIVVFALKFLPLGILIPLGGISYILVLALFGGIRAEDKEIISEFAKFIKSGLMIGWK